MSRSTLPALRGTLLALSAALSFGVTPPLVQRFGRGAGPFATAATLYAGAFAVGLIARRKSEAGLGRAHAGRVTLMAALGAGVAPALLAWGLARASGVGASLMLNLEAVFTLGLARVLYKEHFGGRVLAAALVMLVGGALVVTSGVQGEKSAGGALGLLAVLLASLAWAADNAIAKPLSQLDPGAVVSAKAGLGTLLSVGASFALGERWPAGLGLLGLAVVGATGYGLSLRLYLRAQRALGAGRTASVFAIAPFCGAAVAWGMGEPAGRTLAIGALAFAVGAWLHATEDHAHAHVHEAVAHAHPHRHDDGHHDHIHDPMPDGEHTHGHTHERIEHAHAHVPDVHHEHEHD